MPHTFLNALPKALVPWRWRAGLLALVMGASACGGGSPNTVSSDVVSEAPTAGAQSLQPSVTKLQATVQTDAQAAAQATVVPESLQPLVDKLKPTTVLRWSDPVSKLPMTRNDLSGVTSVTIPAGWMVILDVSPPVLPHLNIEGILVFEDNADLSLRAASIGVTGSSGRLQVGTAAAPFQHKAVITLTGARTNTDSTVDNDGIARGLNVNGGALMLYGTSPSPAWTQLNAHAAKGAKALTLKDSVDWSVGDQIVVAPTDYYNLSSTDLASATAVSATELTLSRGLSTKRWGKLQYATDNGMSEAEGTLTPPSTLKTGQVVPSVLDERAEVGNLSRRIVIQGANDEAWSTYEFGAHVMIMGRASKVVVDGVEFRRVGQAGKLGRYPFHWHRLSYDASTGAVLADPSGHVIRNSTIWQSSHRCIVIHATNGVQVLNNICYDIKGHAIFFEDAVERRNKVSGNLVLKVRQPTNPLKRHEITGGAEAAGSSAVWLTNPDNTLTNNRVGDIAGVGYWLAFPEKPLGLSRNVPVYATYIPLREVSGNTAHSTWGSAQMMMAVPVDDDVDEPEKTLGKIDSALHYRPREDGQPCEAVSLTAYKSTPCTSPMVAASVKRQTLYKARQGTYRNRVIQAKYLEWVTADGDWAHFSGAVAVSGVLERTLLVGHSLNNAHPQSSSKAAPGVGVASYHSTLAMSRNVFVNFPYVDGMASSGKISDSQASGAFMTDDYYLRPVDKGTVFNADNVLIKTHPGYRVLSPPVVANHSRAENYAVAGALWDPHGYWSGSNHKGNYVVYDVPFLTAGKNCFALDGATTGDAKNGKSCDGEYLGITGFITDFDPSPYQFSAAVTVQRLDPSTGADLGSWEIGDGYGTWTDTAGKVTNCSTSNPPPAPYSCSAKIGWMRHAALANGGQFKVLFPRVVDGVLSTTAAPPRLVMMALTNAYRDDDNVLLGIHFDGRLTPAGHQIAGTAANDNLGPILKPSNYTSNPAVRLLTLTSSLDKVKADTTGKRMWQDKANNLVWVRFVSSKFIKGDSAANITASSADQYYRNGLAIYPKDTCTGAANLTACVALVKALP